MTDTHDAISRKAALEAISEADPHNPVKDAIAALPSVGVPDTAPELPKLHICHSLATHFNDGWTLHMHQGGGVSFYEGLTIGRTYSLEEGLRAWAMSAAVPPAPSLDVAVLVDEVV